LPRCSAFERCVDSRIRDGFAAVDAGGVDAEQNIHAVPGASGYLGGEDTGIEPERDGCMAQVVRASGDRGNDLGWCQGERSGGRPADCVVGPDDAAAACLEKATVVRGPELGDVIPEDFDQLGRDRKSPDPACGTVLEPARRVRCRCRSSVDWTRAVIRRG
jgi:hypothetical protein